MTMTTHARTRMQQRGLPAALVQVVEQCGRVQHAPGGAEKIFFGRREAQQLRQELKRMLQFIDKAQGATLIMQGDTVITAYKGAGR